MNTFGYTLKLFRVVTDMSQQEAAEYFDVTAAELSRWENGRRYISKHNSERIYGLIREYFRKERGDAVDVILDIFGANINNWKIIRSNTFMSRR